MITISNKDLSNRIEVYTKGLDYYLIYLTEEIESFSRDTLKKISYDLGGLREIHLYTNAGVDLHHTESELHGIKVHRLTHGEKYSLIKKLKE